MSEMRTRKYADGTKVEYVGSAKNMPKGLRGVIVNQAGSGKRNAIRYTVAWENGMAKGCASSEGTLRPVKTDPKPPTPKAPKAAARFDHLERSLGRLLNL